MNFCTHAILKFGINEKKLKKSQTNVFRKKKGVRNMQTDCFVNINCDEKRIEVDISTTEHVDTVSSSSQYSVLHILDILNRKIQPVCH